MDIKIHKIHPESEGNVADLRIGDEALELQPLYKVIDTTSKKIGRNKFLLYKFWLAVNDFIIVLLAFGLSGLIIGSGFFMRENFSLTAALCILSLVVLAFFPTFNLYNYHQIFLKKKHLANLVKSFGWSLVTLGIITFIYICPQSTNYYLIYIIFLFALLMLLLSRFFWSHLIYIIEAIGVSFLIVGMNGIISPDENPIELINWGVICAGFLSAVVILTIHRYLLVHVVFNIWLRRHFRRQVVIVGSDEEAKNIAAHIVDQNAPYWVAGVVGESGIDISVPKKRLGAFENFKDIVRQNKIDEIIITDVRINRQTLITLLDFCTTEGLTIWFPPKLMPIIDMKLYIENFCDLQMIRLCSQKNTWIFNKIKHGLDAMITLPMFILLMPFFFVIAVMIKLHSKGPVFYRAKSVGKNGKIFSMYKFRSMRADTNSDIHKSYVTELIKGKIDNGGKEDRPLKIYVDPRVTSVGRFLRKFSLDELPQLINVLKGDMSLVGPRPCLPYEYEIYKDWHKRRTSIRPGITGLWQVAGRSSVEFEDMILFDLYYIYNRSLIIDFSILYETIFVVLGKRGAY